jgi:hypothetical protein
MASTRLDAATYRGFLVPDARFDLTTLSSSSSYTEAGPRPGSPVPTDALSRLGLQVSGEQDIDYTIAVSKAGMPTLGGARITYRATSGAATTARGWMPPNVITAWTAAEYVEAASETMAGISAATMPSGQILVLYIRTLGGASAFVRRYDPDTDTWTSRITVGGLVNVTNRKLTGLTVLPNGRVLAYVGDADGHSIYFSDDEGDTWATYARNVLLTAPSGATPHRMRMAYLPGGEVVLIWTADDGAGTKLSQYVSTDLGTSFTLVGSVWTSIGGDPELLVTRTGTVLLFTIASNLPYCRSVASPFDSLEDATAVAIDGSQTVSEITGYVDFDNVVYAIARSYSGNADQVLIWRSKDEGATWEKFDHGILQTHDASTYPTTFTAVPSVGSGWLVHQWVGAGDEDLSVGVIRLGGYSSVVLDESEDSTKTDDAKRLSFGPTSLTATRGQWIPIDLPHEIGTTWSHTGSGDTLTDGGVRITTTAGTSGHWTFGAGLGTADNAVATALFNCTANGSTSSTLAGYELQIANGSTYDHKIAVRASTTGFAVADLNAGTTLATVTVSMTAMMEIETCLRRTSSGSRVEVRYRRPYETLWTVAYQGAPSPAGSPAATGSFKWGNGITAAGAATTNWRMVQVLAGVADSSGKVWVALDSTAASTLGHSAIIGRTLTGLPYPLGDLAADGVTYVRGTDGPGYVDETYSVPVEHDYGAEHILAPYSPSPRRKWKATGTSEVIFTFVLDEGNETVLPSRTHAIFASGINFPTWYWEASLDGNTWLGLGTYNGTVDFSGLSYTLTGNVLRPNTATTAAAGRYIHRGEFVGASVNLGSGKVRRILRHTEGIWSQANGKHAEFILEGIDGTEPNSGTCSIVAHTGVLIVHGQDGVWPYYRIRIPASQMTASGVYEAGLFLPGGFQPLGQEWAWGSSREYAPNARSTTSRSGTVRRRKLGPVLPSISVSWTDGVDTSPIYGASPTPDYYAPDAGYEGLANASDVWTLLTGILEETRSGELMVVALSGVPGAADNDEHTITDPTLFMYGSLSSSVSVEGVQDAEDAAGDVVRVNTLTVVGVV